MDPVWIDGPPEPNYEEECHKLLAERDRMSKALLDIHAHSVPPFSGEKWMNYIHEVATEGLGTKPPVNNHEPS